MNNWFEWNGVKSIDKGVYVMEQPAITLPEERATFINIPGRSGSLTQTEGPAVYDDLTLSATCFVQDTSRVAEIASWLRGAGKVTFANRQGGFYHARVVNQIPFEKIMRGRDACSFAVNFRCSPFFMLDCNDETFTTNGSITNPTLFESQPSITVHGTSGTVMIGDYSVLLDNIDGYVTLDCEAMFLHKDGALTTATATLVDEEWPVLLPGSNLVSFTGGISKVVISPKWRTL